MSVLFCCRSCVLFLIDLFALVLTVDTLQQPHPHSPLQVGRHEHSWRQGPARARPSSCGVPLWQIAHPCSHRRCLSWAGYVFIAKNHTKMPRPSRPGPLDGEQVLSCGRVAGQISHFALRLVQLRGPHLLRAQEGLWESIVLKSAAFFSALCF